VGKRQTFLTIHTNTYQAGEKEVRCWVIQKGTLAPQAAGVIHGDFERGFIKAEVVAYQDFHDLCEGNKSMGPIKAAGKFRQEGKTYVVQGGDIIHFQFSRSRSCIRHDCIYANKERRRATQKKVKNTSSVRDARNIGMLVSTTRSACTCHGKRAEHIRCLDMLVYII
jgi:hypothetical protein